MDKNLASRPVAVSLFVDMEGYGAVTLRMTPPAADGTGDCMISVWRLGDLLPAAVYTEVGETVRTLLDIGRLAPVY